MRLTALAAAALLACAGLTTPAQAQTACVTIDAVVEQYDLNAVGMIAVVDEDAAKLARALSEQAGARQFEIVAVVAFHAGEIAEVYGFDASLCAIVKGTMRITSLRKAWLAAGIGDFPIPRNPANTI